MFIVETDETQLVPGTRDAVLGPYKTEEEAQRAAEFFTRHTGLPCEVKPAPADLKLPYSPPTLTKIGTVAELTGTPGTVASTEPILHATPKTAP